MLSASLFSILALNLSKTSSAIVLFPVNLVLTTGLVCCSCFGSNISCLTSLTISGSCSDISISLVYSFCFGISVSIISAFGISIFSSIASFLSSGILSLTSSNSFSASFSCFSSVGSVISTSASTIFSIGSSLAVSIGAIFSSVFTSDTISSLEISSLISLAEYFVLINSYNTRLSSAYSDAVFI